MLFDIVCQCSAALSLDMPKEKEDASWLLINRFINAHVGCGLMTPLPDSAPLTTKRHNIDGAGQ